MLVDSGHVRDLHSVLTGLGRDSVEMREVFPLGGSLLAEDRVEAVKPAG